MAIPDDPHVSLLQAIEHNPGIGLFDGGTAYSFGDNNLFGNGPNGNGADNGSFTSTQQYK